jgi:[ribosomal protein S18]-alanine N-acetyltransferase
MRNMTRSITLRLAQPKDSLGIARMSRDLIEYGLDWSYPPLRIRQLIADRETIVLVAAAPTDLAGFAAMRFTDERAHLVLMAVRAEWRRQGMGRQMLDWLLASASTAGIASLHLELRAGNRAALSFYRALGFSVTVRIPGYYQGRESAIRMLRLLRPQGEPPPDWQAPMLGRFRPE